MRMMKRNWGLWMVGVTAVGALLLTGVASADQADVSTERSGSVVVFPKVLWDGTRDTIIQLSNTGNPMVFVHCFYINASPQDPFSPPSAFNPPQWNETDFDLLLTKQQPTHWTASEGRPVYFFDPFGDDEAGLDPGAIPPVPVGFRGELKCVQVDESGAPFPGNALKGEAHLRNNRGDISEYNAIALQGNPNLSGTDIGTDLQLNMTTGNPGGEYSACPNMLLFNHFADCATDPVLDQLGECESRCVGGTSEGITCSTDANCPGSGRCLSCPVTTTLTLVPCQENLENQVGGRVTVQFEIRDEFETPFSASTTVNCWLDAGLNQISAQFKSGPLDTLTAFTRINPVGSLLGSSGSSQGGVLGVAVETRWDTSSPNLRAADAAFNLNTEGNRFDAAVDLQGRALNGVTDHIVIPAE